MAAETVAPAGTVSDVEVAPLPMFVPEVAAVQIEKYPTVTEGMPVKFCAFVDAFTPVAGAPTVKDCRAYGPAPPDTSLAPVNPGVVVLRPSHWVKVKT